MTEIVLRAVSRTQGNNRALKNHLIDTDRFRLDFEEVPVLVDAFRRMVRANEFDVCEMSLTTYLCAKQWAKPFTALPIFLVRGFHHGAVKVARSGAIANPKALEGKRVGVNRGYTVTTGVWARGVLERQYGVDLDRVTWVRSGDEHVAEFVAPPNVEDVPAGATLDQLLAAGKLAAVVGVDDPDGELMPLIAHSEEAALSAFGNTGHYPINHLIVVRDELLAQYSDLAQIILEAFSASKKLYVQQLVDGSLTKLTRTDRMHQKVLAISGSDPLPYGVGPNRAVLDELLDHALSQHILDRRPTMEELFAAGTLDWVG